MNSLKTTALGTLTVARQLFLPSQTILKTVSETEENSEFFKICFYQNENSMIKFLSRKLNIKYLLELKMSGGNKNKNYQHL